MASLATCMSSGDHQAAVAAWSQAHAILLQLDVPEAGELAGRLQDHTPDARIGR